jgi:hypothetical protein
MARSTGGLNRRKGEDFDIADVLGEPVRPDQAALA